MNIGENIRRIRLEQGMSQTELSQKIMVTQTMICRIEKNSKMPSLKLAVDIARALGCTVDDIVAEH